jgi:hypothetical protein
MKNQTLSHLSDTALDAELKRLARTDRDTTVAMVAHLAEYGARRSYLAAGFSSLFEYCRVVLALSEGEAYNRVVAARVVRRFPAVLGRLDDGSVNLTTIRLLHKHLTEENHTELLTASTRSPSATSSASSPRASLSRPSRSRCARSRSQARGLSRRWTS